jgi:hypothetical protein
LINWLHARDSDLFIQTPTDRYAHASYPDANDDLTNAGGYYSGPSYIVDYQISERYIEKNNHAYSLSSTMFGSATVDAWMREHGLYKPAEDNPDPHFAERAFVVNVLVPAYGPAAVDLVTPGKEFPD